MKKKSSKINWLIISITIILLLLISLVFIQLKTDNIKKYGELSINYNEFKNYKESYNLEIKDYDYDIQNRFENPKDLQNALTDINKINYIYQEILFMHTILTKESTSYILKEDKDIFLNTINEDTLKQWNEMLLTEEKSINKELLTEEEIHLLENVSILRELMKNVFLKSFKGEYDTETLTIISKNIGEQMGYLITINLVSDGHNKQNINEVLDSLRNDKETFFKDSFYYKYMFD